MINSHQATTPLATFTMEQKKADALRRSTVDLVQYMNPDQLKAALYAKGLLTDDELERLGLLTMTTREKNMFIVTRLPSKGPNHFDIFIDCLQETTHGHPAHEDLIRTLLSKVES